MRYAEKFEPIKKRDTVVGRFWSAAHRAEAKRDRAAKRRRRQLRYLGIATALLALVAVSPDTEAAPAGPTHTDARCMQVIRDWNVGVSSAKADWIGNYIGCDEVYNAKGHLVGFGKGKTTCERRAYRGNFIHHLINADLGRYMAAGGCDILYEDWSWGS